MSTLVALFAIPPASAAPVAEAIRTLQLKGGGVLQVATRFRDEEYHAGDPIDLDPLIENFDPARSPSTPDTRAPIVLDGFVGSLRAGYAPCVGRAGSDVAFSAAATRGGDCVEGTPPIILDQGSPAHFSVSFSRLFRITPEPQARAFGYGSFVVTLQVLAANGETEVVSFPVTVTVEEEASVSLLLPTAGLAEQGLADDSSCASNF